MFATFNFPQSSLECVSEGYALKSPLKKGCYIIEVKGANPIRLCLTSADQRREITLPVKPYSVFKYFFYLPVTAKISLLGYDLAPFDQFAIKRVTFRFAKKRLINKILTKHYLYQGRDDKALLRDVKEQAADEKTVLFGLYDQAMQRISNIESYYPKWYQQHATGLLTHSTAEQLPVVCVVDASSMPYLACCLASLKAQSTPPAMIYILVADATNPDNRALTECDLPLQWVDKETIAKSMNASHAFILPAHCVLHPHALGYLGHAIDTRPDTQLLYTDSDHIYQGAHVEPLFKPDFDPVLLEQVNYIGSAVVLDRRLLLNVLAKPADILGGQFLSQITFCDKEVFHIRKVLVGERKLPPDRRYPSDFYNKIAFDNAFCENHASPFVSVIIPTRDQLVLLQQAVNSILQLTTYPYYEIIIVDNDSRDQATRDYLEIMSERDNIQVITFSGEFNYSAINNQAVAVARGEYLCLLNNDVKVMTPHWLEAMLGYAQRPSIGCVGAKLYYANDTVQHAGVVLSPDTIAQHAFAYASRRDAGYMGLLNVARCVSAVTGACLMVAKSIYLSVDGLNATDLKVAYNDIDFCLKVMRAGYRNVFTPEAELYHFESISRGIAETPEEKSQYTNERAYMLLHWGEQLAQDPYYNTNFSTVGYSYCLPATAV